MNKPGHSVKPHLFRFAPATQARHGVVLWAAVRYNPITGLYYWDVGEKASIAYKLVIARGWAATTNPYFKLKKHGWA